MRIAYPNGQPICGLYIWIGQRAVPVPLSSVNVEAQVCDMGALVEITQTYHNSESNPIEAVYKFPLDEKAAVCGFEAVIDGKRIVGQAKEKEEAFRTYDEAISRGDGAYLVDEERPDLFTMSVGNLPPNKTVTIKLTYLTQLVLEGEKLRFVLPTAVAPRYTPARDASSRAHALPQDFEQAPVNTARANAAYGLNLAVHYNMTSRIKSVMSPTHTIAVDMPEAEQAVVELASSDVALDKDFVLLVGLADIHAPKVLIERDSNNHACAAVSLVPELDLEDDEVASDIVFVVDCSGSMSGSKIEQCRNALQLFLRSLPENVKFNIVRFGSSSDSLFNKSEDYNDKTLAKATKWVDKYIHANMGGTEILRPLQKIYSHSPSKSHPRQIFLLTDGQVSNTDSVIALCGQHASTTRVFTFGIGHGASTALVNGCARAGRGVCEMITGDERIEPKVMRQLKRALQPSLTNVSLEWTVEGAMGTTQVSVEHAPSTLPPLFQGDRMVMYGFIGSDNSPATVLPDTCILRATCAGQELVMQVRVSPEEVRTGNAVHKLAARELIRELEEGPAIQVRNTGSKQRRRVTNNSNVDSEAERKKIIKDRIVALACKYQLASRHTSFVAVEKRVGSEKEFGELELRNVPVPAPDNSSNLSTERRRAASSSLATRTVLQQQQQLMSVMNTNIDRVMDRGCKLDDLQCQSASLQLNSASFAKKSKKLKKGGGFFSNMFGGFASKSKPASAKREAAPVPSAAPGGAGGAGGMHGANLSASFGFAAPAPVAAMDCAMPSPPPAAPCAPSRGFGAPVPAPEARASRRRSGMRDRRQEKNFATPPVNDFRMFDAAECEEDDDDNMCDMSSDDEFDALVPAGQGPGAPVNTGAAVPSLPSRPDALIQLQRANGSWAASDHVLSCLNIDRATVDTLAQQCSADADTIVTALVVAFLALHYASCRDEWDMIAAKARRWIKQGGKSRGFDGNAVLTATASALTV